MDLDTMITRAAPSRHVLLEGPDSLAAARLREHIIRQPVTPSRPPKRRRYIVRGLVGAAIAGAAVVLALAIIPGSPGAPGQPDAAAAAVLGQAAVTASQQPAAPTAGSGQYEYVKTIQGGHVVTGAVPKNGVMPSCVFQQTVEFWVAPDGSGREAATPDPSCHSYFSTQTFTSGKMDYYVYPDAAALPTSPAALNRVITRLEGDENNESATFYYAGNFLQSGAPPKVRAALYRLIESLPGVRSLGSMTDRLGRHGVAVGYTEGDIRSVLIFDPATSAVLEWENVVIDPARMVDRSGKVPIIRSGTLTYTIYVSAGVVNSDTATPH